MHEQLCETATAVREAATGASVALELMTPGWGSSGYYSAPVLEAAGRDRVFPAGTHMYIDHPSASEDRDRPERSVRDLAAVLTTDGTWNGTALVAEARVFAPYQQLIAEMKAAEDALIVVHDAETAARARRTIRAIAIGSAVGLGLLALSTRLVDRHLRERRRAEAALQRAHDELGVRVAERTADLGKANEQLHEEIRERERAEERQAELLARIEESHGQMLAILDQLRVGTALVDPQGRVLFLSQVARRLLAACGLDFEAACLNFHETDRPVRTASSEQVRKPIFTEGLEQWRRYEAWLDPLRAALGPALETWDR